jgi:ADP-heptose:LPS heptosyltransferase
MRVLALVPGGIERQLEFLPLLHHIKQGLKATAMAVVVDPQAKPAYGLAPVVTEVIPYNFQGANSPADWANLLGILRDREYDVVITLAESWSLGLLLWLSGIPTRIGYPGGGNDRFLTTTVARQPDQPYQGLLDVLNLSGPLLSPNLSLTQADLSTAEGLRQEAGLRQGYVAVYPGPTGSGDTYPTDSWVAILKDFQQRQPDLSLVLLQTPEAIDQVAAIQQSLPNLTTIAPDGLGQLAALIAGANLLVAVNSYPLWLAQALQVYAVGLNSNTHPSALPSSDRLIMLTASPNRLAEISPAAVLAKIWDE